MAPSPKGGFYAEGDRISRAKIPKALRPQMIPSCFSNTGHGNIVFDACLPGFCTSTENFYGLSTILPIWNENLAVLLCVESLQLSFYFVVTHE